MKLSVFCCFMSDKITDFQQCFYQKKTLNVNGQLVDLHQPKVMGILNLTPDSFFDGGRNNDLNLALKHAEKMINEGADFIDVGAYSSRPNAENIPAGEEMKRLLPVIKQIALNFPAALISVDTFRAEVAAAAINEGAHLINDISGGQLDEQMFETVARLNVPYVLMHMKGTPQTMVNQAQYTNVLDEVTNYFIEKTGRLKALGVKDIIIDPGFGFAKTRQHSFELLAGLKQLQILGLPILAGLSRKSMIYKTLQTTVEEALSGTIAANTIALMNGANILRVHDVKEAVAAIKIVNSLQSFN